MAKDRKARIKIEDLPRPAEELTPEQAERLTGGAFSKPPAVADKTVTSFLADVTYNSLTGGGDWDQDQVSD
jgi:hypothetical protein